MKESSVVTALRTSVAIGVSAAFSLSLSAAGTLAQGCAPDREAPAGIGTGKSVIAFTSIANGKVDEETAAERLNAGCFDVYLADPREAEAGGQTPPRCRGHIRGTFSFFFERGRPSQPFP